MRVRLPSGARFSRDAWLLIAASCIFSVSFYGVHNLLRVLYVLRLGHGPEYVGVFGASSALTYMGMGLPSGALGQRFGARGVMLVGSVIMVIGMIALPLVEFLPASFGILWPIATQIFMTAGWSMVNVSIIPGLMAATTPEERSGVYAANGAVRSLGTFAGTIVGGLLPGLFGGIIGRTLDAPDPYRYALWVAAAITVTAIAPIALLRIARPAPPAARVGGADAFPMGTMAVLLSHVALVHGSWATLQAFGNAYMDTDLLLPASIIGLITGAAQLVATATPLFTPRLVRRSGDAWTLMMSGLAMGISLVPLALIPHWSAAALSRVGNLSLDAMWLPTLQLYQMERVTERWRTLAYGIMNAVMGLSFGLVSLIGGYIVTASGYRAIFAVGVGLSVAGTFIMWGRMRRERAAQAAVAARESAIG